MKPFVTGIAKRSHFVAKVWQYPSQNRVRVVEAVRVVMKLQVCPRFTFGAFTILAPKLRVPPAGGLQVLLVLFLPVGHNLPVCNFLCDTRRLLVLPRSICRSANTGFQLSHAAGSKLAEIVFTLLPLAPRFRTIIALGLSPPIANHRKSCQSLTFASLAMPANRFLSMVCTLLTTSKATGATANAYSRCPS